MPVEAPAEAAEVAETPAQEQARPRNRRSATEVAPQTMEVEKIQVDKEKSEVHLVDEEKGTKKLIANRNGEKREIAEISREITVGKNQDELEVTLKVTPKEIDKGAEVIVLLDISNKMTRENIYNARKNIKDLVDALKSKHNVKEDSNYNNIKLITFYNKINKPVELTSDLVNHEIDKAWVYAKEDRNWGVDLQGAIHKAREILNSSQGKKSGKRQHIVLFSQGESTFSYNIKEKNNIPKIAVEEPVTYTNPLLPWPFYFDTTTQTRNIVKDAQQLVNFLDKLGIGQFKNAIDNIAHSGNFLFDIGKMVGLKNPLDFISTADLDTSNLEESRFDYNNRLGEGYNFRSYADRKVDKVGLKSIISKKITENLKKLNSQQTNNWLDTLGLTNHIKVAHNWIVDKVLDNLLYRREYEFYNHNLSAQAEAKMARDEGIKFYSFDVTTSDTKESKFDKYIQNMSEDSSFLTSEELNTADKFRDILNQLSIRDTFSNKISLIENSFPKDNVKYISAKKSTSQNIGIFSWSWNLLGSVLGSSHSNETLTWTISKDELKKAFEDRKPLTLTYKLKINKDKFNGNKNELGRVATNIENKAENIISNTISYKINEKQANGQKLDDVTLTYSKERVLVPEIDGEVVEPQAPQLQELPPVINYGPDLDFTEDTIYHLPLEHGGYKPTIQLTTEEDTKLETSTPITTGGQSDPIDIVEDTQSGMSGDNSHTDGTVLEEDSKPSQEDEVIIGGQGQVIDFTEDTQSGMSGDNSYTDGTVLEEDSKPSQGDEVIIGGQGQVIDFTEDTQTGMSGAGQVESPTITEETHKPEIIMGGQSDPIDMVEDTLPGMSGSNEATVVEEDTRPKLQFHFDNEEPVPATVPTVSQTPIAQVESKVPHAKAESALPQTGDTNKLETFFTITALTVIGAAGLLGKKRRNNQTD
ncbi:serum opacification factor [Streptococcus dysgalactiae]|nr:serum opacification factor [Streptococcus dysgalactiae]